MNQHQNPWTDERDALLRSLWDAGETTMEIGRRMGITKNAVIGRARRLCLTPRASPINIAKSVKPRALSSARPKAGRTLHFPAIRPAAQSRPSAGEPGAAAATALCFSSPNLPEADAKTPPPRVFFHRKCCYPACHEPVRANARNLPSSYCVAHFEIIHAAPTKNPSNSPPVSWLKNRRAWRVGA